MTEKERAMELFDILAESVANRRIAVFTHNMTTTLMSLNGVIPDEYLARLVESLITFAEVGKSHLENVKSRHEALNKEPITKPHTEQSTESNDVFRRN